MSDSASRTNESHAKQSPVPATRCWWCGDDPLYVRYHDEEWAMPVRDDRRLFEKVCLEGFQAGLSWLTILRKRDAFRRAFHDFDFVRVAQMNAAQIDRLVQDATIVRHRGKIESTINNAKRALEMIDQEGSLASFFWRIEPERAPARHHRDEIPSQTDVSKSLSRELKRRGWSFVGPTTCYAMMQSCGMVNDHLTTCPSWQRIESIRAKFKRP